MQKKIKSKQNDSLFKYFVITIFICLIGAFISSALFYKGFFRALTKLNEEPIATITFKYKTAQRKFLERVVWDRLRQNSPVYNGDTIHTENLAEATVYFIDGNVIAVFTAMGMCWSGFLSTHTAMLDSLGYRQLTSKAIVAHTIGGLCAGIAAHWLFVLINLIF